jgi:hypothetical protein
MAKSNLEILEENLRYLGFGDYLVFRTQLSEEIQKNNHEFQITTDVIYDQSSRLDITLYFRKAGQHDMYFIIKYTGELSYPDAPSRNKIHTFYIYKGSGVTLKEAYNLLQGRSVNKDLTDHDGDKYNAWLQLDFQEKTDHNNYKVRQFRQSYGYDLEKTLENYPIRELKDDKLREHLIKSLKKGNLHMVTFQKTAKIEDMYIEACPQYKTISIYSKTSINKPLVKRNEVEYRITSSMPGVLNILPAETEEQADAELDEETDIPVEETVHAEEAPVKKRNRR